MLANAAQGANKVPLAYADYLTRWWVALLRACELKLAGLEIPVNSFGSPADILFSEEICHLT